jgi:signal transduction histidine kinase
LEKLFFPGHYAGGARYSATLETRNRELRLLLDELNRRQRRSFQMDKLAEMRHLLEGIAARIGSPVESAAAELSGNPRARSGLLELRDFARKLTSLAGRSRSGVQRVSVEALCRAAGAELCRRFPGAEVRLEGGAAEGVRCHPEELAQVLRCLLDNAAEAGAGRPILLRLQQDGGQVSVCVEDEGPGFPAGWRPFRPFRSTKPGHDGLGLYFCKTLVERNGGSIRILPPLDCGARVQVTLRE